MVKSPRYRKNTTKKQNVYKMKGCSHLARKSQKVRCPLCGKKGGSVDVPLAYTGEVVETNNNPFLAYTGNGGAKFPYNNPKGILAVNKLPRSANLHASFRKGGSGISHKLHHRMLHNKGFHSGLRKGGSRIMQRLDHHRLHNRGANAIFRKGGGVVGGPGGMSEYQPANYYPNGTVGDSWGPSPSGLPGVDGVSSNHNFLSLNTYQNDPQTQNIVGERTVSNLGLFGGRRRSRRGGRRSGCKTKKRGGACPAATSSSSNGFSFMSLNKMIPSDIMNPLRSASHSVQGSIAALQGRPQPPNPLPENGQLKSTTDYNSLAVFQ